MRDSTIEQMRRLAITGGPREDAEELILRVLLSHGHDKLVDYYKQVTR